MNRINYQGIILLGLLLNTAAFAENLPKLSYNNTDFNKAQADWADTLTITNESENPIEIKQLSFETNYESLDTTQLYGTINHPLTKATPTKLHDFDYEYSFATNSPYNANQLTVIPAHGSVNLTGIPIAHQMESKDGIPVYYRLPFNIKVTLKEGTEVTVPLAGKCTQHACLDPANGKVIGAYFANWANYHYSQSPMNMLMPNQIPIEHLNTIYYAIGKLNRETADISFSDINHDQNYLPAFDTEKQQYPYLNLFYSFGGWGDVGAQNYPSYDLAAIFDQQNDALIQKLADNMVHTMQTLGFNGIDIDYEWNAIQPNSNDLMMLTKARALGYEHLLQAIRKDLNKIQPSNNAHYYKLTTAVFLGTDKINDFVAQGGDWKMVASAIDAMNVMAYDIHGQFDYSDNAADSVTDFQSQMATEFHYQSDLLNHYNVIDGVNAYEAQGVPANKIVVGIPAYTRIEKTNGAVTDENKGLYLRLASQQPAGEAGSGGVTDYKCILDDKYCWNNFHFNRATLQIMQTVLANDGLGHLAKTPWAYDKAQQWFMSFDDATSAKLKAKWVLENQFAGMMMWEMDGDIPKSDVNYKRNSLIYNIWSVFGAG